MMKLLQDHPLPWSVRTVNDMGAYEILDSKNAPVIFVAEYTGDGATVNMDEPEAREMVALINRA